MDGFWHHTSASQGFSFETNQPFIERLVCWIGKYTNDMQSVDCIFNSMNSWHNWSYFNETPMRFAARLALEVNLCMNKQKRCVFKHQSRLFVDWFLVLFWSLKRRYEICGEHMGACMLTLVNRSQHVTKLVLLLHFFCHRSRIMILNQRSGSSLICSWKIAAPVFKTEFIRFVVSNWWS